MAEKCACRSAQVMIHHDSAVAQGAIGTLANTGVLDGALGGSGKLAGDLVGISGNGGCLHFPMVVWRGLWVQYDGACSFSAGFFFKFPLCYVRLSCV